MNPVHTLPTYVFEIQFNILLYLGLASGLFPAGLPTKTLQAFLSLP